jgi:indolepyruvate ferredoxin oxidoreductase beta subunit
VNINICGVGGQGVLFASKTLAGAFLLEDRPVLCAETHGMSQRGGFLLTHLRTDEDAVAPLVPDRSCDLMVSLELLEPMRQTALLSKESRVVVNDLRIVPLPVTLRLAEYPSRGDIIECLGRYTKHLEVVDFNAAALRLGGPILANVVALGYLADGLPVETKNIKKSITEGSPERFAATNIAAFKAGMEIRRGTAEP